MAPTFIAIPTAATTTATRKEIQRQDSEKTIGTLPKTTPNALPRRVGKVIFLVDLGARLKTNMFPKKNQGTK